MKCLVKNLLGIVHTKKLNNSVDVCAELPPIVKSLVASAMFLIGMVIVSKHFFS